MLSPPGMMFMPAVMLDSEYMLIAFASVWFLSSPPVESNIPILSSDDDVSLDPVDDERSSELFAWTANPD
jgi:hypothetical protein